MPRERPRAADDPAGPPGAERLLPHQQRPQISMEILGGPGHICGPEPGSRHAVGHSRATVALAAG
jgi:hypothetical protein